MPELVIALRHDLILVIADLILAVTLHQHLTPIGLVKLLLLGTDAFLLFDRSVREPAHVPGVELLGHVGNIKTHPGHAIQHDVVTTLIFRRQGKVSRYTHAVEVVVELLPLLLSLLRCVLSRFRVKAHELFLNVHRLHRGYAAHVSDHAGPVDRVVWVDVL